MVCRSTRSPPSIRRAGAPRPREGLEQPLPPPVRVDPAPRMLSSSRPRSSSWSRQAPMTSTRSPAVSSSSRWPIIGATFFERSTSVSTARSRERSTSPWARSAARASHSAQRERRDTVGVDVLGRTLRLGERRDRRPCLPGERVVDLEEQRLVGLDDERPVGHARTSPPGPSGMTNFPVRHTAVGSACAAHRAPVAWAYHGARRPGGGCVCARRTSLMPRISVVGGAHVRRTVKY